MIEKKSDLVIRNGPIYTVAGKDGWAQALAVSEGRIVFVGSDTDAAAYVNPDNTKLTAVIINTSADTDISLNLSIKGISVSKGEIYRSSQNENCILAGNYNGEEILKIPKSSVTTLSLFSKGD